MQTNGTKGRTRFYKSQVVVECERTTYANEEDLALSALPTQPTDLELIGTIGEQMLEHCH